MGPTGVWRAVTRRITTPPVLWMMPGRSMRVRLTGAPLISTTTTFLVNFRAALSDSCPTSSFLRHTPRMPTVSML